MKGPALRLAGRVPALLAVLFLCDLLLPAAGLAIQTHQGSEGIIVHQVGHLFFLLSMVVLVFIITGRELNRDRGWRMIQYSAVLFVLWNLDTIIAHFFDNQIQAVTVRNLSLWQVKISAVAGSELLVYLYHGLKLDHLFCVPALFLFYRGLSNILSREKELSEKEEEKAES
ncbi:MAG: hypothetical protein MI863_21880 [Desulfobacterales bacterium]|nr:hypothetical protein [Desulfobacterales bacterium]